VDSWNEVYARNEDEGRRMNKNEMYEECRERMVAAGFERSAGGIKWQ
jgi:hypothetical protein